MALFPLFVLSSVPQNPPSEIDRVRTFARVAATDRDGQVVAETLGDGEPRRSPGGDLRGQHAYRVGKLTVFIDPASGLVMGAWGNVDHAIDRPSRPRTDAQGKPGAFAVPRQVGDDLARAFVARIYAATGRPHGIEPDLIDDQPFGNWDDLAIYFWPTYKGVPFAGSGGQIEIDRETGELDSFRFFNEPPKPPASVVPGVSSADAHLVALRAAAASGVTVRDYPKPLCTLKIATLDRVPRPWTTYSFTSTDHADALAGRSRLVYDIHLYNAQQGPSAVYFLLVDARDGRLLQVKGEIRGIGATDKPPASTILALPTEPSPWRIGEGDEAWSAPVMSALALVRADGFAPTRKLLMTDSRLAFTASYDPKTELIGVETEEGKFATYRPGLADFLRKKIKG